MEESTEFTENVKYSISYYGVDFPIDSLVKRMEEDEFIIPDFQRKYVWDSKDASRFIESVLLRLPVPAIFLARDKYSHKLIVIDGQQRLKTLLYFTKGEFPDGKKFKLKNVVPTYEGKTYDDLDLADQRDFNNAVIHALVLNETEESDAMFHVFERINTTGTPLTSQEIRYALYQGSLNNLLSELSEHQ
ncbi:MAG: DUF262 domain-containing protein [Bacteroidota bacterium]